MPPSLLNGPPGGRPIFLTKNRARGLTSERNSPILYIEGNDHRKRSERMQQYLVTFRDGDGVIRQWILDSEPRARQMAKILAVRFDSPVDVRPYMGEQQSPTFRIKGV